VSEQVRFRRFQYYFEAYVDGFYAINEIAHVVTELTTSGYFVYLTCR
jgi:hypothetical protein